MGPREVSAGVEADSTGDFRPAWEDLLPALTRLDERLKAAIAAAASAYGPEAGSDAFRGLHITPEDVQRMLAQAPGVPVLRKGDGGPVEPLTGAIGPSSRLAWLQRAFGLSAFDLDVIVIALAPELDLRYERLYAYLQDDVSLKRPGVDLTLNLLCASAAERLARRTHFAADAPLIAHGLIHLLADSRQERPPLLAHGLRLDPQILGLLLGEDRLDARLADFCALYESGSVAAADWTLSDDLQREIAAWVRSARQLGEPLRLYFQGVPGIGRRTAARAMAGEADAKLLIADLARLPDDGRGAVEPLRVLFREAWLQDALLYLDDLDALRVPERARSYDALVGELAAAPRVLILAGSAPWVSKGQPPTGVQTVHFPMPDAARRRDLWQTQLEAAGLALDAGGLSALAERFRLTPAQIADAVAVAYQQTSSRPQAGADRGDPSPPRLPELFAAARAQCGQDLAALATKVTPVYGWDDIVLPQDTLAQLREICQRVTLRERVMVDWGFGRKLPRGKGVTALFAGPSGTGKTMAAEIVAGELGLDLYRIDLAGVVSKYIGETEKNLDRIFRAAEDANAILFFDEADALFGKRSEVRDSHDRYANIEISYLLQKMEQYEGVAILATNLGQNLDEAFVRRLAFAVHFPFPGEEHRRRIWAGVWPEAAPQGDDVDLDLLARQFKLSGGNIKNVALAAGFFAADTNNPVTMSHLVHGIQREYQKMGKTLSESELNGQATVISLEGRRA